MKTIFPFSFIIIVFSISCHSSKNVIEEEGQPFQFADFSIASFNQIQKDDLLFHLDDILIQDSLLHISVQYSGGCVKPHVFSLITDGVVNERGFMNFALLHKTKNDQCKALLKDNLTFDISSVLNLGSHKLKGISFINKDKTLSINNL